MILKRLVNYYERQVSGSSSELAKEGFQKQEIHFIIVLDRNGKFKVLLDTRTIEGKKRTARVFSVPRGVKKTVNIAANLLWDNAGYVLGIDNKGKPDRAAKQKNAFLARIVEQFPEPRDAGIDAVIKFYQSGEDALVLNNPLFPEVKESNGNISFSLEDDDLMLICQRQAVIAALSAEDKPVASDLSRCLITGDIDEPIRLHTAIKGVRGAQSSGANIVSFNLSAFNSYGKEQGLNAPIGKRAEFAYTTALNSLLAKGSPQRIQIGDASTVFWAAQEHKLESWFVDFFGGQTTSGPLTSDSEAIQALYASPKTGVRPLDEDPTPFYILGLAPNAARISIRFWHETTVSELSKNIRQHFDDIRIVHSPKEPEYLTLFRLLVSIAVQNKSENIPPNLAGEVMRAILADAPYPYTLLANAIMRTRANRSVDYPQAALIKAFLARRFRKNNSNEPTETEVDVSLNESNTNCGYLMGRLFAVLERAQELANPGINATIRDRFYGAASATPVTVFPNLLKLKNHHISKMQNRGMAIHLEREIGQIMENIKEFPAHLKLPDQGYFAIGYYHQRQNFFTKKDAAESPENNTK